MKLFKQLAVTAVIVGFMGAGGAYWIATLSFPANSAEVNMHWGYELCMFAKFMRDDRGNPITMDRLAAACGNQARDYRARLAENGLQPGGIEEKLNEATVVGYRLAKASNPYCPEERKPSRDPIS